jgi:hypothetical protein
MAEIIWPENMGLQIIEPDHSVTDDKRGVRAEIRQRPTSQLQPLFNPQRRSCE